ncbi:DNA-binding protein [Escherichia coli]|uniref:DNA-binding protein n=1 Tax=Escherichia coli TaxID=562 RepID=UPI00157CCE52|nr:DNA-binding protein [Escherichia coli]NUB85126.1 DNA-binding protein [Escherichia coli]
MRDLILQLSKSSIYSTKPSDVCGVSQRAIYKWINNGKLPRTEYTGETNYAEKIALASNGLFSADAILTIGRNKTTTKKLMGVDS